jgi:acetoin utilization protein AcuB
MMRVQDVMTRSVKTISPDETADAAYETMRMRRIHHLVVVENGQMVGVLSDRDLGSQGGAAVRKGQAVRELMTAGVVSVPPDTPMRKVANLLRGRSIGCVPVVEGERVVGIVTTSDLLALVGRGADRPVVSAKRWTLKHRAPHRKHKGPGGSW